MNIIEKIKKITLEKMFLFVVIPIGIAYMLFMLPTYAPDESAHIWKAYEVSKGVFFTNGKTVVPKELLEYQQESLNTYNALKQSLDKKTDYNDTVEIITPAQSYPFFLYIPSAIGIAIGRILDINILYGIYLGKVFNFIIYVSIGYYAIKKMPFGKIVTFVYLLLPMILCQAISLSADSILNSLIVLYIAFILQLFYKEKITQMDKILCMILPIIISISKLTYFPIVGLNFLLINKKEFDKKEKYIVLGLGTVICLVSVILYYLYTTSFETAPAVKTYMEQENVNSTEQIKFILTNPIMYIKAMIKTVFTYGQYYIDTFIGSQLGWLNIGVNRTIINAFLIILLFSPFVEENDKELNKKQKIWICLLAIATIILIITGLYITWSPVGGEVAVGVQGRYFIPIVILFLLCLCMKENYIKIEHVNRWTAVLIIILNLLVLITILKFFYI